MARMVSAVSSKFSRAVARSERKSSTRKGGRSQVSWGEERPEPLWSKKTRSPSFGKPVDNPHESHEHVTPLPIYYAVFGALLFLTGITYLVSYADLGPGSLPVAMLVAVIKASLVVGFFMHLKYEDRTFQFMFVCALLFVSIFFTVVLFDMDKSDDFYEGAGIEYKRGIEDTAEQIAP